MSTSRHRAGIVQTDHLEGDVIDEGVEVTIGKAPVRFEAVRARVVALILQSGKGIKNILISHRKSEVVFSTKRRVQDFFSEKRLVQKSHNLDSEMVFGLPG